MTERTVLEKGHLLAAATRTSTTVSAVQTNLHATGVLIHLHVHRTEGKGGLLVELWAVDPVTGNRFTLARFDHRVSADGAHSLAFGPDRDASAGADHGGTVLKMRGVLPRNWGATVSHADDTPYTYEVTYEYTATP